MDKMLSYYEEGTTLIETEMLESQKLQVICLILFTVIATTVVQISRGKGMANNFGQYKGPGHKRPYMTHNSLMSYH